MSKSEQTEFSEVVWGYYHAHARKLPWREVVDNRIHPYHVLVSEIMLQQTQVNRVVPKFEEFIQVFPTLESLAESPLSAVLSVWSGLGYNRRAKYLHEFAIKNAHKPFPRHIDELVQFMGIGRNTAAAVLVYSYNERHVFVDTIISTVYLYHYFNNNQSDVNDTAISALVEQTLPASNYREWYWALMDYGSHLKASGFTNRQSKHYTKQSVFVGSRRQVRGQVLKHITLHGPQSIAELERHIIDERFNTVLSQLEAEGLIVVLDGLVSLP